MSIVGMGLRSLVCVPLYSQGRLSAVLCIAMAFGPRTWAPDEVALVETVAGHTRLAIESAQSQQREHRIATELQTALIPQLPDGIPGLALSSYMCPALDEASIGGDFCDVFPLDKGRYGILIATCLVKDWLPRGSYRSCGTCFAVSCTMSEAPRKPRRS